MRKTAGIALLAMFVTVVADAGVTLLRLDETTATLPPPWMTRTKKGTARVSVATVDGRRAVCLDSRSSSFSIERRTRIDLAATPNVTWTWRADELPLRGDLRDPKRDDQAAQLFIAFGNRRAISYVWDSNAEPGTTTRTWFPFVVTIRVLVVQSGPAQLHEWITRRRNVADDYRRLFGEEPPATVDAVRFQINSQYTSSHARSCLAALTFEE